MTSLKIPLRAFDYLLNLRYAHYLKNKVGCLVGFVHYVPFVPLEALRKKFTQPLVQTNFFLYEWIALIRSVLIFTEKKTNLSFFHFA